jgi:hypothetical protein
MMKKMDGSQGGQVFVIAQKIMHRFEANDIT